MFLNNFKIKNILYKKAIYIVSTPIGNIFDISIRSLYILKNVNLILSEDTRVTNKILNYFNITNKIISFNDYNNYKINNILKFLDSNKNIALVSDAGTPLINDPGYILINKAIKNNVLILSVPGPCAAIAALSISGLRTNKFCYEGFIPRNSYNRIKLFKSLYKESRTMIFYESPLRILKSLNDMEYIFGFNRNVVFVKEITKIWEMSIRGNLKYVNNELKNNKNLIKGEIIIVLEGFINKEKNKYNKDYCFLLKILYILKNEININKVIKLLSKKLNINKNYLYNLYLSKINNKKDNL